MFKFLKSAQSPAKPRQILPEGDLAEIVAVDSLFAIEEDTL